MALLAVIGSSENHSVSFCLYTNPAGRHRACYQYHYIISEETGAERAKKSKPIFCSWHCAGFLDLATFLTLKKFAFHGGEDVKQ